MTSFAVDLDELESKIREMVAFERTMTRALAELDASVEHLHLTWTGEAAAAHRDAHRTWAEGMRRMSAGLAEIRSAAERAHANYSGAGATNFRMWAAVR
jgi:WXG100 family type VII secretion target